MGVDTGKWHYVDNESRYSYRWIDLRSDWVKKEIRDIFRKENWCVFSLVLGSLNAKCVNRFMELCYLIIKNEKLSKNEEKDWQDIREQIGEGWCILVDLFIKELMRIKNGKKERLKNYEEVRPENYEISLESRELAFNIIKFLDPHILQRVEDVPILTDYLIQEDNGKKVDSWKCLHLIDWGKLIKILNEEQKNRNGGENSAVENSIWKENGCSTFIEDISGMTVDMSDDAKSFCRQNWPYFACYREECKFNVLEVYIFNYLLYKVYITFEDLSTEEEKLWRSLYKRWLDVFEKYNWKVNKEHPMRYCDV